MFSVHSANMVPCLTPLYLLESGFLPPATLRSSSLKVHPASLAAWQKYLPWSRGRILTNEKEQDLTFRGVSSQLDTWKKDELTNQSITYGCR